MIAPFYNKNQCGLACQKLVKTSQELWKKNDDSVDDITCIVIYLKK